MASVRKRANTHQVTWQVRWRTLGGGATSRTFPTKREAIKYAHEIEARGKAFAPRAARDLISVKQALDLRRHELEGEWRPTTRAGADQVDRAVAPIRTWPMARMTPDDLRDAIADKSPHVRRQILAAIRQAARIATNHRYDVQPGLLTMPVPTPKSPERTPLTLDELDTITADITTRCGPVLAAPVQLLPWLGLRVSELSGLQVHDINLATKQVRVIRAVTRPGGTAVVGEPKSDAGRRVIPIPDQIIPILTTLTKGKAASSHLISAARGGYWDPKAWRRQVDWEHTCKQVGHEHIRLHDLRHTYATIVRAAGGDLKTLQTVMGHTSITVTMNTYGHLWADEINRLGTAISAIDKPAPTM